MPAYEGGVQQRGLASSFGNAQPSLESFGGGVAAAGVTDAAQSLVGEMGKFVLEEKKKADDLAVSEYWSKLNTYQNDRIYNTKDGLMTRRGKNSFGAAEEFEGGFKQFADKLDTELLKSSDQRIAAKKIRDREYGDFDGKIQSHLYKERVSYDEETTKASLEAAKNDALLNYQTPGKVGAAIKMQMDLLSAHASRTGKDEKWVENESGKLVSGTHTDIIERMIGQGNDQAATAYHNANKGELTGDDSAKIEKALEIGSTLGAAQRAADNAWDKSKGDLGTAANMIFSQLKNKPKAREQALNVLRERSNIYETDKKQTEERVMRQAMTIIQSNHLKPGAQQQIDPVALAKLKPEQLAVVQQYQGLVAQGLQPKTVWSVRESLMKMGSDPKTRDQFKDVPISLYRMYLDDSDMGSLLHLQTSLRNGDEKSVNEFRGIVSDDQVLSEAVKVLQEKKKISTNEEASAFKEATEREALLFYQKNKRRPNNEELRGIISGMTVELTTKEHWYGDATKLSYQVQPGEVARATKITQIPATLKTRMENIVRSNITEESMPADIKERIRKELKREGRRGLDTEVFARFNAAKGTYLTQDRVDQMVVDYYNKGAGR